MANVRSQNVWVIDTDAQFTDKVIVKSIKLIGGSNATSIVIKSVDSSGQTVYQSAVAQDTEKLDTDLCLKLFDGWHANITGTGAIVYLYLE